MAHQSRLAGEAAGTPVEAEDDLQQLLGVVQVVDDHDREQEDTNGGDGFQEAAHVGLEPVKPLPKVEPCSAGSVGEWLAGSSKLPGPGQDAAVHQRLTSIESRQEDVPLLRAHHCHNVVCQDANTVQIVSVLAVCECADRMQDTCTPFPADWHCGAVTGSDRQVWPGPIVAHLVVS